jgi:hypothetical protein
MWAGSGISRHLALAMGAFVWTVFDALWSQIGPAHRFFVGFTFPASLLFVLYACAVMLEPVYQVTAKFLDRPSFDPFHRD